MSSTEIKCVVCGKNGAEQSHHLRYDPEITIQICKECHLKIHGHGVGFERGLITADDDREIISVTYSPKYTERIWDASSRLYFMVTRDGRETLNFKNCPNCGTSFQEWFLMQTPSGEQDKIFYIICPKCRLDFKFRKLD